MHLCFVQAVARSSQAAVVAAEALPFVWLLLSIPLCCSDSWRLDRVQHRGDQIKSVSEVLVILKTGKYLKYCWLITNLKPEDKLHLPRRCRHENEV